LLVVRGELRRTGRRGVSLRATGCWELPVLHETWRSAGIAAVRELVAQTPPTPAGQDPQETGARRVLVHSTGFRLSPYADIKPAGETAPRKLWHSSPGSSGR
jgi:error-prone DNA polymerase